MSFGDDNAAPQMMPPPVPPPLPSPPQFATGAGRLSPKGKPFGGTLVTSPIAPAPRAQTAQRSLVNI